MRDASAHACAGMNTRNGVEQARAGTGSVQRELTGAGRDVDPGRYEEKTRDEVKRQGVKRKWGW
jgi:hypothetical protein